MAFEVGRHIIGYEVQKILALVDWFAEENRKRRLPIGVMGYGEGGLLALYSAAIDTRIDATAVSGYYQAREDVWKEPIYRDVWGLVREFGDAELAGLIAPRALIVEASPRAGSLRPTAGGRGSSTVCLPERQINYSVAGIGKERGRSSTAHLCWAEGGGEASIGCKRQRERSTGL